MIEVFFFLELTRHASLVFTNKIRPLSFMLSSLVYFPLILFHRFYIKISALLLYIRHRLIFLVDIIEGVSADLVLALTFIFKLHWWTAKQQQKVLLCCCCILNRFGNILGWTLMRFQPSLTLTDLRAISLTGKCINKSKNRLVIFFFFR